MLMPPHDASPTPSSMTPARRALAWIGCLAIGNGLALSVACDGCGTEDPQEGIEFPCDNGVDDDGDGYTDCDDNGCWDFPGCEPDDRFAPEQTDVDDDTDDTDD